MNGYLCWLASLLILATPSALVAQQDSTNPVTFDKVQQVLRKRCASCHGRDEPRGGLDLTTLDGLKAGSDSGPVAVAGMPELSMLYNVTAHLEEPKMPPGKERIPASELQLLSDWIAGGMLERVGSEPAMPPGGNKRGGARIAEVLAVDRPTAITALAVNPAGSLIAVSGVHQIVLLEASSGMPTRAFPFPDGEVFALRFSNDGDWLVAGGGLSGESGKVVVFDAVSGERVLEAPEERDSVLSADLTADRRRAAWGGPWRTVQLFDLEQRTLVASLTGQTDWVLSVGFSPDGLLVAGSDRFGALRVWKTRDGEEFWNLRGHAGAVPAFCWSPSSDQLLSVGEDGTAQMWDLHTGEQAAVWEIGAGGLWAACWHHTGVIAVGGRSKEVVLLNPDGKRLKRLTVNDQVTELEFLPDGSQLIVADAAGYLTRFSIPVGEQIGSALALPVAEQLVRLEIPWPVRSRAKRSEAIRSQLESTSTSDDPLEKALLETESAIKQTEGSLARLKETAELIRKAISARAGD